MNVSIGFSRVSLAHSACTFWQACGCSCDSDVGPTAEDVNLSNLNFKGFPGS
jgi:hypothetical protein